MKIVHSTALTGNASAKMQTDNSKVQPKAGSLMPETSKGCDSLQSCGSQDGSTEGQGGNGGPERWSHEDYRRYIDMLKQKFPGANIHISDLDGESGIKDYAQSHLGGFEFVISEEALKRMALDEDFRDMVTDAISQARQGLYHKIGKLLREGKAILGGGIAINEDGFVSHWVASRKVDPLMKPCCKKPGTGTWSKTGYSTSSKWSDGSVTRLKTKDGKTITISKKLYYRPAKDLTRIARASNQQMVKSTISSIHAQIYQIKTGKGDRDVKRQLVGQAEQVLMKARIKIKNLKKEELLKHMQKSAERKAQIKRAVRLKMELEERQTKRKVREYGQIRDYYPSPIRKQLEREREEKRMEQAIGGTGGGTGCAAGAEAGLLSYSACQGGVSSSGVGISEGSTGVFVDISL